MATRIKKPGSKREGAKRIVRRKKTSTRRRRVSPGEPTPRTPVERRSRRGDGVSPDADRSFSLPHEESPDAPAREGKSAVVTPDDEDWDDDEPTTPWRVSVRKKQPLAEPAR
jgi:hypothetical protein